MALHTFAQADQYGLLKHVQAHQSEASSRPPRGATTPYQVGFDLTTVMIDNADDRARLIWFPSGFWVMGGSVYFPTAVDAHATPTFVWDLITETAAGVADTRKLITGATAGQAANSAAIIDPRGIGMYVGERYLVLDPTTAAATAAAGRMILTLLLARGVATNALPSITLSAVT